MLKTRFLTDSVPGLDHAPVDVAAYCDPAFYAREKEGIFKRCWMMACRDSQIPEAGDYVLRSLPGFGISLIFVRGRDGVIRGFYNACRHRANAVCIAPQGNTRRLVCRFHNWVYDLDGRLTSVPDEKNFFDLDKDQLGLIPVATESWNGFVFFTLDPDPKQSLTEHLGGFGTALDGYPFARGTARFQISATVKANWKSVIDSFSETYHVPALHTHSIAETLAGGGNVFGHLVDAVTYGPHRTASVWGNKTYQPKPVQGICYGFAAKKGGEAITGGQGERQADSLPPGVNPARSDNWGIDVNVIFPNMVLVVGPGTYFCHQMWPISEGETRWEMTGFWAPAETAADRVLQEYFLVELRDAVAEDLNTLERVQANIAAGVIDQFHYHDHEVALRHQHHAVRAWLDAAGV